jgi:predicted alpha/beta-fold hydrolase
MHSPLEFHPLPFLTNPHLQTVVGAYWPGYSFSAPVREHRVLLPDGDQLVLHDSRPARWRRGERIVLLIHGLGGSHHSPGIRSLAGRFYGRGLRLVRIDLRGAGHGESLARRGYHAGCSDDVRAALHEICGWSPTSSIVLVGYSLGGNVVLKLAGEARQYPVASVERVAAVSPPIDMVRCSELLSQPRNMLYEKHYVSCLVKQLRRQER